MIVPDGITLKGANAGQPATAAVRDNETILSDPVTLVGNAKLDGLTISAKPIIDANTDSISAQGVRFDNLDVSGASNNLQKAIIAPKQSIWGQAIKLDFQNCYFSATSNVYNAFELNFAVADGSIIANNDFADMGSHNIINLYQIEDGATVEIRDNHFAKSINAIRVAGYGANSSYSATVNIDGNSYDVTDTNPNWAGLFFIQPYGSNPTDMSGITINCDNTVNNTSEPQIWYYYAGNNDSQLAISQRPKVFINGTQVSDTDYQAADRS